MANKYFKPVYISIAVIILGLAYILINLRTQRMHSPQELIKSRIKLHCYVVSGAESTTEKEVIYPWSALENKRKVSVTACTKNAETVLYYMDNYGAKYLGHIYIE